MLITLLLACSGGCLGCRLVAVGPLFSCSLTTLLFDSTEAMDSTIIKPSTPEDVAKVTQDTDATTTAQIEEAVAVKTCLYK